MFPNLRAEMARRKVTNAMLADALGVTPETLLRKLCGKSKIDLDEALSIKRYLADIKPFEPDMPLEVLFAKEN